MREKSRMLLISAVSRSLSSRIIRKYSWYFSFAVNRPSSSVSAYSRISASGVRSSCETLATKSDFSLARFISREMLRYAMYTPPAINSESAARVM